MSKKGFIYSTKCSLFNQKCSEIISVWDPAYSAPHTPYICFNPGSRRSIFGGTTQLNLLSKSGLWFWVVVYLDYHVHVFEKRRFMPRPGRNKALLWNASKTLVSETSSKNHSHRYPNLAGIEIWSEPVFGEFLGNGFPLQLYTAQFQVWLFLNSGEGFWWAHSTPFNLTLPPIQASPSVHPLNMFISSSTEWP